jgi:sigma-54 dependent transcriptional regulator, acetoin dehydrogenase operon transcriptional activator AcoR
LENVIERAINLLDSESIIIEPKHLPQEIINNKLKNSFKEERILSDIIEQVEKRSIERCLKETKWNKNKTAKLLGISRASLYKKIEKYNMEER